MKLLSIASTCLGLTCLIACTAPAPRATLASPGPWAEPPLDTVTSIRNGRTGQRISFEQLLDELAPADAVFVGESHIDETTHRVEFAIYEGLLDRRRGRVVLAMEMFERDVQPALDAYLRGEIDEPAFLASARPWGNYATAYRPMIERARRDKLRVVASNFPTPVRRKLGEGGDASALDDAERQLLPAQLLPNQPAYWRRVDNAVRGHANMMGPKAAPEDPRLWSTQSLWDNAMGESCARALEQNPGNSVLHVNGGFHTESWDGTARQLVLRRPGVKMLTVAVVPHPSPSSVELSDLPFVDFVVFAESRALDVDEGTYTVHVSSELRYRLHVPKAASEAQRVPLLVWMPDDGENAEDALALWRSRLGDRCAVAVVEAPYRETQEDGAEGRRWFWADTFASDCSQMASGLRDLCAYVARNLPVEGARIVIAGEGTGGTMAAAIAVLGAELPVRLVSIAPRRFAKLKDFPLPLPEQRSEAGPTPVALDVLVRAADEAWWTAELAEYTAVGLRNTCARESDDPWSIEGALENAVRSALDFELLAANSAAPKSHVFVHGARERAWARKFVHERQRSGERIALLGAAEAAEGSTLISTAVHAADITRGAQIPRASGPFGGTTVLVLPHGLAEDEAKAWSDLANADPLAKSSKFHRMVLAETTGERALPVVLRELAAKNRKNILIVPALWSATGEHMRALKGMVGDLEEQLNLSWRPGLGGLDPH